MTNDTALSPARMIERYERAVARHPFGPLTYRQHVELKNLHHWKRRAAAAH
ncbi:hypothetical protein RS84_00048 [Microbacterium hydrocarbonoxydans]|uniref:Uncharacterized protein n=1 Tax=Microbacterium hydrocarbonoxydans TaxID=273678 RepID=A0A0M2HYS9_9MICO|nr:hypothetical protein [Microbacterium hydrocarbonoxydans]KJL49574.1 hypothetical protein RS84_00048 [Microbacterium hydrocarbonoxydans]